MVKKIEATATAAEAHAIETDPVSTPPGLDNLMQMADAADTAGIEATDLGVSEQQDGPLPPARPTNAEVLTSAFKLMRDVFAGFTSLQTPAKVVTDEKAAALGAVWGAVADKHRLDLFALTGDYGLELAAIVTTVPIALALRAGVREEMEARAAKAAAEPADGATLSTGPMPAPPPPATFTPGMIVPSFDES